ncbi:MAG: phosphopyruvate hydratase [Desulfurococcales archaeon]|nr:phosphopyruvate hydratase [Desulfurococcales archaeon]
MYPTLGDDRFRLVDLRSIQVLDSRGRPTVRAYAYTKGGGIGIATVPSGASTGKHEAVEIRDGGKEWKGLGVSRAVSTIETTIRKALLGVDVRKQAFIDSIMKTIDSTPNKSKLGGNAVIAVSIAVAKAAAATAGLPLYKYLGGPTARLLPAPLMNLINGGAHAGNKLDLQEFMIIPVGADSFKDALRVGMEVYYSLKDYLKEKYGADAINVGDEGGFAPPMKHSSEALSALVKAIRIAGYEDGVDVVLAIDAAASQFYDEAKGKYRVENSEMDSNKLLGYYESLIEQFPIKLIEDPAAEDDWDTFRLITSKLGCRVLVVGDDLYTTNVERLKKGLELKATNAVLVKPNQIGTLTETIDFAYAAARKGWEFIISHRSGDTEDPFIADLAVGLGGGFIKTGAPARSERIAKYNRLLEIEGELGPVGLYNRTIKPRC